MTSTATTDLRIVATPAELRAWSRACHEAGLTVGMVPTMGALHAGHRSLVERALRECDRVAVSIFVNPAQFGPTEDLARYPRPLAADLALLREAGVDTAFVPAVEAMYRAGATTTVDVGADLSEVFEGALRPGHFSGVALVVTKLINACDPDRIYFGQKDAQQVAVVRRLVRDLDCAAEVVVCPVVRDHDGVALSSRNAYLDPASRAVARAIPEAMSAAADAFARGERSARRLTAAVEDRLRLSPLAIDYVAAVDPETLAEVETAAVKTEILLAVRIAGTRLIDVLRLGLDAPPVVSRVASVAEGEAPDVAGV